MAHWRSSALEVLEALPAALQPMALELPQAPQEGMDALIAKLRADPLCTLEPQRAPQKELEIVTTLGGFVGFGGPFGSPPDVINSQGQLYAFDNETCWSVHVDRFGATLQRYGAELPSEERSPEAIVSSKGAVRFQAARGRFEQLAAPSSVANDEHMMLVAMPHSHHITVIARAWR
jgi:hypothetical protein